jgi:hypothetical protein
MHDTKQPSTSNGESDVPSKHGSNTKSWGLGLPIGLGLGAGIGAALGNVGVGVAIGCAVGIGLGGMGQILKPKD